MDNQPLAYEIPEACRQMGNISRAKLNLLIQEKAIRIKHIGRRVVVLRDSIEDYLTSEDACHDASSR
jgi:hypothetical protein